MRAGFSTCEAELRMTLPFMTQTPETPPPHAGTGDMVNAERVDPLLPEATRNRGNTVEEAAIRVKTVAEHMHVPLNLDTPPPMYPVAPDVVPSVEPVYPRQSHVDPVAVADAQSRVAEAHQPHQAEHKKLDGDMFAEGRLKYAAANISEIGANPADLTGTSDELSPPSYRTDTALDAVLTDADRFFLLDNGIAPPVAALDVLRSSTEQTSEVPEWDEPKEALISNPTGMPKEVANAKRLQEAMNDPDEDWSAVIANPNREMQNMSTLTSVGPNIPASEIPAAARRVDEIRAKLDEIYGLAA